VIVVHAKSTNTMKIQKIVGENGILPKLCGNGACPAAIIADTGDVFVQGYVPAPTEQSELTAPSGGKLRAYSAHGV
jgi:hypothetical protein